MKIVHIAIAGRYIEGAGYQENILPAFHKLQGHDVYVLAVKSEFSNSTVNVTVTNNSQYSYVNSDGLKITILRTKESFLKKIPLLRILSKRTIGLYEKLQEIKPDIIFIHGLQSMDSLDAVQYIRTHPEVKLFVDQHGDYYNSPIRTVKQKITQKIVYRFIAQKLLPFTSKFWGVTPWRVQYLNDVYGIPKEKIDLLVMGGDDRYIDIPNQGLIRHNIRQQHNIPQDAFVIITGGKIDDTKNIAPLIEFIQKYKSHNIYLLVFGKYDDKWSKIISDNKANHLVDIGWLDSNKVYDYFLASDLGCFLGTHSVLWEQLCASGTPGIFKDWDGGFNHVDVGGNAHIISDTSFDNIEEELLDVINNKNKYASMKIIAETKARNVFSYNNIAQKSIGL